MEDLKNKKKNKKVESESEEEEEIEEVEEEVEEAEEEELGEDFSKDPRAFTYLCDAGKIADASLQFALGLIKPGVSIYEVCTKSDAHMNEQLAKIYNKKKFIKGIAFPTSIAVNEVCGNYSAQLEESGDQHEYKTLSEGDLVKVDLGVHINGFAAVAAYSLVVSEKGEPVTGKKADVILAAYNAAQTAVRAMFTKNNNYDVTNIIKTVCDSYKVTPVEGVLSHRMKRDIIDGVETIINHATYDQKVDQRNFEHGDVFGLDVIVSTGEGKPKETEMRVSIFKRAVETTYKLKTDSSRKLLSIVEQNFHTFPFSFNVFDNEENLQMKNAIVSIFIKNLEQY
jgi:curved DNA binding protein